MSVVGRRVMRQLAFKLRRELGRRIQLKIFAEVSYKIYDDDDPTFDFCGQCNRLSYLFIGQITECGPCRMTMIKDIGDMLDAKHKLEKYERQIATLKKNVSMYEEKYHRAKINLKANYSNDSGYRIQYPTNGYSLHGHRPF